MIANSGHDERGKYSGGRAGDQTGREWELRSWYNRPWDCVLRYKKDKRVGTLLGNFSIRAAKNNCVGYNQADRMSYDRELRKTNDPARITTLCNADCSAGVIANTRAVGRVLGIQALADVKATYTGNMRGLYRAAGFSVLTAQKYLTGERYLEFGDILLNDAHHVAVEVGNGIEVPLGSAEPSLRPSAGVPSKIIKRYGNVIAGQLAVRTWAGTDFPQIKTIPVLYLGDRVGICDSRKALDGSLWYYICVGQIYGFVLSDYVQ